MREIYTVQKTMHLGPIRREIKAGSTLIWEPEGKVIQLDHQRIFNDAEMDTIEAMRQLKALVEQNPDDPCITQMEDDDNGYNRLLIACQQAYRKHVMSDESIGWDALGDELSYALSDAMGDEDFTRWVNSLKSE